MADRDIAAGASAAPDPADEGFPTRIAALLRTQERLDATFEARLMAAVRSEATPRTETRATDARREWWRGTRTVTFTPLASLAMAAGVAGIMALSVVAGRTVGSRHAAASAVSANSSVQPLEHGAVRRDTVYVVRFVLFAPAAKGVTLVGDFNNWNRTATQLASEGAAGVWTATVSLSPGRYEYAFIVDGTRWMPDPTTPLTVQDDFGTTSSLVTIGSRAG
jgi:hypothetical protein